MDVICCTCRTNRFLLSVKQIIVKSTLLKINNESFREVLFFKKTKQNILFHKTFPCFRQFVNVYPFHTYWSRYDIIKKQTIISWSIIQSFWNFLSVILDRSKTGLSSAETSKSKWSLCWRTVYVCACAEMMTVLCSLHVSLVVGREKGKKARLLFIGIDPIDC
jgi:hypothetical protein